MFEHRNKNSSNQRVGAHRFGLQTNSANDRMAKWNGEIVNAIFSGQSQLLL
jgi:hypothetical protein